MASAQTTRQYGTSPKGRVKLEDPKTTHAYEDDEEERALKIKMAREHVLIPREERQFGANVQLRPSLSEYYEPKASNREWWRKQIKDTPVPGTYDTQDIDTFLRDLDVRTATYRFKSHGRDSDPNPLNTTGALLLPGAYSYMDLTKELERNNRQTYGFKNTSRDARDGQKDKDVEAPPENDAVDHHMSLTVDKLPSKHAVFKSQVHRFPTIQFVPKIGPSPGSYDHSALKGSFDYNVKLPRATCASSAFKSKTPRFSTSHTKIPGPGNYAPCFQYPLPATVAKMGRKHGLFFSSAFQG